MNNDKQVKYLKDFVFTPYTIREIHLTFDIRSESDVQVTNTFFFSARNADEHAPMILAGENQNLLSVQLNDAACDYTHDDHSLTLSNLPSEGKITIVSTINPAANKALEGLYLSGGILCTQNEPEGFRRITYFYDRPDVMTVYTTTIIADPKRFPILLSNGNPQGTQTLPDGRAQAVWHDPFPKPSYLFALVAGDLDCVRGEFVTCSKRTLDLRIYVAKGSAERAHYALECLKSAMAWDEERFGRECDLDVYMIVAVDDFNAGAMENKGLNIFNSSCVLASKESATDRDYESVDRVIAHEYFHNWTGDRITLRNWFQLTLKEGLTMYRDAEYAADRNSRPLMRIEDVRDVREGQFPEDAGALAHPIRPESYVEMNNFYTATVYEKGREVIGMYATFLGRERFRKAMDNYFERYDGQAVTTDEFYNVMAEQSPVPLTTFKRWYSQAGTPELNVTDAFDPEKKEYALTVKQYCRPTAECAEKLPYQLPLKTALFAPDGTQIGDEMCLNLTEPEQTFTFNVDQKPIPSLLRSFSAPVNLHYAYTREQLILLMRCDTDLFNRYEAGQRLLFDVLSEQIPVCAAGGTVVFDTAVLDAWGSLLDDALAEKPDFGFIAPALCLPSLTTLCARQKVLDFESTDKVRQDFYRACRARFEKKMHAALARCMDVDSSVSELEQRARRSLKWTLVDLLSIDGQCIDTVKHIFDTADNMTDSISALRILLRTDHPAGVQAAEAFKARWHDNALVMNKYFSAHAASRRPDLLENVQHLAQSDCFEATNPNKISALYGVFIRNFVRFHADQGRAYEAAGRWIRTIDAFNPQSAAGLCRGAFMHVARLDDVRKAKLKGVMDALLSDKDSLSSNVYEILELYASSCTKSEQ